MASPLRRGTRIYFRKAVAKDLLEILRKSEIKISLRTTDEHRRVPNLLSQCRVEISGAKLKRQQ